ncbi:hypothetical protein SDC9_143388 [bioreactor metagenome]|uniref:Uncharacterized protein n=1 Tax=bioreactor metagenome TaxID=1076179 RepID=A0A645E385_9ZZZZ
MTDDKLADLLGALGESMGIDALRWDDQAQCQLLIGEDLSLLLRYSSHEERITLAAVVADTLPDPLDHALTVELLEHALSPMARSGPAIGLDRDNDLLLAYWLVSVAHLDATGLVQHVQDFLAYVFFMRERIAGENRTPFVSADTATSMPLGHMV